MSEIEGQRPEVDAYEMKQFGLDPSLEQDRQFWAATTPTNPGQAEPDYSSDAFEFGGQDRSTEGSRPDTISPTN